VKINANIGSSRNRVDTRDELDKLDMAVKYGSDTVMDLSTGGDINGIRRSMLEHSRIPVGTVPMYQVAAERGFCDWTFEDFISVIRSQAEQGVDYMTVHCGLTRAALPMVEKRLTGVVSRGGAFVVAWMGKHGRENPLYERFDELLEVARKYDVTLSLGDALRPGSVHDASDDAQFHELRTIAALARRAYRAGVQVMIEGPGHIPLDQVKHNMELEQVYCNGAPFYILGPVVTDIAPGYDHITGAIGAAWAAYWGASMLCYVTPREHLGLPHLEDVRQGVVAFRIAAHAADVAKGIPGARERDDEMSRARKSLNWERQFALALDPETAARLHGEDTPASETACSMCADYCSMRLMNSVSAGAA
jgi:phosphomethylpyrimidine synthase